MDWFDPLAVQGTLRSLLQHHSSKASIRRSAFFFMVQLSHPYMTTGKTITLTRQTFVGKVMSLLFNRLSKLVITFLPRSKRLLISWLQSSSAVTLEPPPNKVFHCFPIYFPWSDGTRCHDLRKCWALSQLFHSPLLLSSRSFLVTLHFLPYYKTFRRKYMQNSLWHKTQHLFGSLSQNNKNKNKNKQMRPT